MFKIQGLTAALFWFLSFVFKILFLCSITSAPSLTILCKDDGHLVVFSVMDLDGACAECILPTFIYFICKPQYFREWLLKSSVLKVELIRMGSNLI